MTGAANLAIGPQHAAYVPRLLPGWAATSDGLAHRELDASLVMFDISGFTRLTERLSQQGRAGAEELSDVLHAVFTPLVDIAEVEGADLLKWGGDAVLLLLEGFGHPLRAARAARGMHRVLGRVGHLRTSVGRVVLRASSGIHSGTVHLVLAGDPAVHRELIVVGPAATAVCRADAAAGAGQIVVTDATAAALPPELLGATVPAGRLLLTHPVPSPATPPPPRTARRTGRPAGHPAAAPAPHPPHPGRERAGAPDGGGGVPAVRRHRRAARRAGTRGGSRRPSTSWSATCRTRWPGTASRCTSPTWTSTAAS